MTVCAANPTRADLSFLDYRELPPINHCRMSRFIITLLAIIATTSAKPYVVSYAPGYYGGFIAPSYSYNYPYYNSYPFTPVTYVETIVNGPPPVAAIPIVPAKLTAKNAASPAPASAEPKAPSAPAPAPAGAPAKLITITKTAPELPDLQGLLSALPIQQILELPPVKLLAELKTNKLQAISGLQSALQEKLAPIAALLP